MLFVLLYDVLRVCVKLQDFLVCTPCKEDVLLVFSWMEFDTERSLPISETSDNFTSLSVPKLNDLVKRSTEELLSIVGKLNITHCFSMAHVRP
jgi:hypothetical protein